MSEESKWKVTRKVQSPYRDCRSFYSEQHRLLFESRLSIYTSIDWIGWTLFIEGIIGANIYVVASVRIARYQKVARMYCVSGIGCKGEVAPRECGRFLAPDARTSFLIALPPLRVYLHWLTYMYFFTRDWRLFLFKQLHFITSTIRNVG